MLKRYSLFITVIFLFLFLLALRQASQVKAVCSGVWTCGTIEAFCCNLLDPNPCDPAEECTVFQCNSGYEDAYKDCEWQNQCDDDSVGFFCSGATQVSCLISPHCGVGWCSGPSNVSCAWAVPTPTPTPIPTPTPTPIPLPSCTVSLTPSSSSVTVSGTQAFTASVSPSNGTVDRVNFTSSNIGVATVSPPSDSSSPYRTTATGQSPGLSTIGAQVVMDGLVRCSDASTLTVICSCDAWAASSCGGGSCVSDEMLETRTCFPVGCASESRCVVDPSCTPICSCTPWVDGTCGAGSCSADERRQTRTCAPMGCASQSRCVSDTTCTAPPPLSISIPNVILSGVGGSQTITVGGAVGVTRVDFSSFNTSIATVNPSFDSSAVFQTTVTAEAIDGTTYNAIASDGGSGFGSDTATVTVINPGGWWQVKEGDCVAGGSIESNIPGSCDPGFDCDPVLITGDPGVSTYDDDGSIIPGPNPIPPTISSKDWNVASSVAPTAPNYAFFESRIPSTLLPLDDPTASTDGTIFEPGVGGGGTFNEGYYWFSHTGSVVITDPVDVLDKKVILFVNGDLTINGNINLTDGQGSFLAIVFGDITVLSAAGGAADSGHHLEGVYYAQNTFITEAGANQLHLRGSVAANNFSLQRDLADNSQDPAEIFEYGVDQVMAFPKELTRKRLIWREVAP